MAWATSHGGRRLPPLGWTGESRSLVQGYRLWHLCVLVLASALLFAALRSVVQSAILAVFLAALVLFGSIPVVALLLTRRFEAWLEPLHQRVRRMPLWGRLPGYVGLGVLAVVGSIVIAIVSYVPSVLLLYLISKAVG